MATLPAETKQYVFNITYYPADHAHNFTYWQPCCWEQAAACNSHGRQCNELNLQAIEYCRQLPATEPNGNYQLSHSYGKDWRKHRRVPAG